MITLDITWKQTGIEARDYCQEVAVGVLMRNGKVKKCSIVNNTNHCGNASPRWDSSLDLLEWLSSEREEICGEKGLLLHCWQGCKLTEPLWKTVWRVLKNLKIKLPCHSAIPTSGYISEGNKISISKRYLYKYVHCSITYNSQYLETIFVSITVEWT